MEGQYNPAQGNPSDLGRERAPHEHVHQPPAQDDPRTTYNWRIHHPIDGVPNRVAVEVSPRRGLIPRWRFVAPGDWECLKAWGVGPPGGGPVDTNIKRPARGGPVDLVNGPRVVWFGGHEVLSSRLSAYLMFEGEPPHYLAFGQADEPGGPPKNLEGISFAHHATHPPAHVHGNRQHR